MKLVLKKSILVPITLIALICLTSLMYCSKYSVYGSNEHIKDYLIKKSYINENSLIQKQIDIDNIKVVIFKFNDDSLQYTLFQRGLNGKYSFVHIASIKSQTYKSFIERIHNNYYLISLGYNADDNSYINTTLSSAYEISKIRNESFNIKNEDYFIKYKVISDQSTNDFAISNYSLGNY